MGLYANIWIAITYQVTRGSFARTRSDTKMLRQGEVGGGRRRRPCRSRPASNPRAQPSPPDTLTRCVRSWPDMLPPPAAAPLPPRGAHSPILASSGNAATADCGGVAPPLRKSSQLDLKLSKQGFCSGKADANLAITVQSG